MVAAGLLDTSPQHAEAVTNMAFDMRRAAALVTTPHTNESIQVMIAAVCGVTQWDKGGVIKLCTRIVWLTRHLGVHNNMYALTKAVALSQKWLWFCTTFIEQAWETTGQCNLSAFTKARGGSGN